LGPNESYGITPAQIRAARALVKMTADELAERASVGRATVRRAEGDGRVSTSPVVLRALRAALEAAGVEFIPPNGGGPGVRLKERES
jgi:hypothetical protein